MARDEASSEETRSEDEYDTRATEASYLAHGQAWRVVEIRRLLAWFEVFAPNRPLGSPVVQVGALIEIKGARKELLFIAPIGGTRVTVGGCEVRVISLSSPLGDAIAGMGVGDTTEVDSPRGVLEFEVVSVQ